MQPARGGGGYAGAMLLYGVLILCALLVAMLVYRYDLYDREPWSMLALATALGAGFMWLAGRAQVFTVARLAEVAARDFNLTISAAAAVTEELGKLGAVWVVALLWRRHFNDPIDGLIYGSFAGLGCALEEAAVLYGWPRPGEVMPLQEPIRLFGHLVMGGIGGFAVGLWRAGAQVWPVALAGCWTAAVGLHFIWDLIAFSAADSGRMLWWHTAGAVATMAAGLFLYGSLVWAGSWMSRRALAPDSPERLVGWPFARSARRGRAGGPPGSVRMNERAD